MNIKKIKLLFLARHLLLWVYIAKVKHHSNVFLNANHVSVNN